MLVTTCPQCDTTFRLTVAILEKAGGQVRCGRCATIFDANDALREQPDAEVHRIEPLREQDTGESGRTSRSGLNWILHDEPPPELKSAAAEPEVAEPDAGKPEAEESVSVEPQAAVPGESDAAATETETFEADASEAELAATEPAATEPGMPETAEDDTVGNLPVPAWFAASPDSGARRRPWAAGVVVLAFALAGQTIHFFRADIAYLPVLGPALAGAYGLFGIEIEPKVDLRQYDTLDLTAVAEPVTDAQGRLTIETRVKNKGPRIQPFPHIFLRLTDRWRETVAGRYFAPNEYLVKPVSDTSRMNVGKTVDAQFVIVDPGPAATGFELEFCSPSGDGFHCESDETFE